MFILMGTKIIKQEDGVIRKISESYSILNLLTSDLSEKLSLSISEAKDHNETTQTTSERVYYILEGKVIIDDNLIVKEGELVFISANTKYNFQGTFKAILINSPSFDKNNENVFD